MTGIYISGDIGGTKVLLQATELKDGKTQICCERRYESQEYTCFSDMLKEFVQETMKLGTGSSFASACFAVAGPITQQVANLTNLPWIMDGSAIAREFSIPVVKLINDFKAVALGVETLSESDLVTLQAGKPSPRENRVTLGAGTGMGVAWLIWQDNCYIPLSSEAGHMDFASANELQDRLLQYLRKKFGHVSVERILSGPGLVNTFNFLQTDLNNTSALAQVRLKPDDAAQVTDLATNHKHSIAVRTMDLFVEIYGAYAGNLALAGLCRNGVYVAGGIAPRIIDKLGEGGFMKAFRDKGRFSALMEDIPVRVVMNPKIGLLGATQEAQRIARNN
ncbi:MAG: glucokinase [Nitrosospira sp.]